MKMKTATLVGQPLDWAVAFATATIIEQWDGDFYVPGYCGDSWPTQKYINSLTKWRPSTSWNQCGPLIEQFKPWLSPPVFDPGAEVPEEGWDAEIYYANGNESVQVIACPTPQIAVCRAVVLLRLGEEVEIPDELGTCSQLKE